jgi:hypothetical protein
MACSDLCVQDEGAVYRLEVRGRGERRTCGRFYG